MLAIKVNFPISSHQYFFVGVVLNILELNQRFIENAPGFLSLLFCLLCSCCHIVSLNWNWNTLLLNSASQKFCHPSRSILNVTSFKKLLLSFSN